MKHFNKSIPSVKYLITFLLLCRITVNAQQKNNYNRQIEIVYKNIYRCFYESSKNVFIEKTKLKADEKPYAYLWPLCALIQATNEMETLYPKKQYMQPVIKVIDKYYNAAKPPHPGYESYLMEAGGDSRFYDDNQWIGIAYMDAYHRTKDTTYLNLSKEIYGFVMTGYDTVSGGGLYWKEFDNTTKNTCSNGPGILLALQLYKATKERKYFDTAMLLYNWVNKTLLASDGLYYDNIRLPSKEIDKRKFTYNAGTMLQSNVLLYEITNDKKYLLSAQQQAAASLQLFYKKNLFPENYWFNAVLLRGYIELYNIDKREMYITAFKKYAAKVWQVQKNTQNLVGTQPVKSLIDQAAYLEILVRLQSL